MWARGASLALALAAPGCALDPVSQDPGNNGTGSAGGVTSTTRGTAILDSGSFGGNGAWITYASGGTSANATAATTGGNGNNESSGDVGGDTATGGSGGTISAGGAGAPQTTGGTNAAETSGGSTSSSTAGGSTGTGTAGGTAGSASTLLLCAAGCTSI